MIKFNLFFIGLIPMGYLLRIFLLTVVVWVLGSKKIVLEVILKSVFYFRFRLVADSYSVLFIAILLIVTFCVFLFSIIYIETRIQIYKYIFYGLF